MPELRHVGCKVPYFNSGTDKPFPSLVVPVAENEKLEWSQFLSLIKDLRMLCQADPAWRNIFLLPK